MKDKYDVIVIGGGHAGCEAALATARMGLYTAMVTMSLDQIANMPCNPSIGGTAKGHLVFEINALGGQIGKVADFCMLQSRMLNRGKGAAVQSLRMQVDRNSYHVYMKKTLEQQKNLNIMQDEIIDILIDKNNNVYGVIGKIWGEVLSKAVIITCGTYLDSKIFIGKNDIVCGPDGGLSSVGLSDNLKKRSINLRRFKTGTPARINKKTVDLDLLKVQYGDKDIVSFSDNKKINYKNKMVCHITYTNKKVHDIINKNLDKSPLYMGMIKATGARYCPSIEDKIVRFKDKDRHQIFLEPMGINTQEMYLQGLSSCLPLNIQQEFIHEIEGLKNAVIMRPAYAIEYECIDPLNLYPTLEFKNINSLYGAGQFNGTSGYEEAAAQGIIAGINAALKIKNKPPLIMDRNGSYIGTLINDLVTKGTPEPYRIMTARCENRLYIRQDNTNERLISIGYKTGLISKFKYNKYLEEQKIIDSEYKRLKKTTLKPNQQIDKLFVSRETSPLKTAQTIYNILKRPEINYSDIKEFDIERKESIEKKVMEKVEIKIKYEGYIKRQEKRFFDKKKLQKQKLSQDINYKEIKGLRNEAIEKLGLIRPIHLAQASEISGVNPVDITVLQIWLKKREEKQID